METLEVTSNADFNNQDNLGLNHLTSMTRLKDTKEILDEATKFLLSRYGMENVTYSQMDSIFDFNVSGLGGMSKTKTELIKGGMSPRLVEKLEKRYLARVGGQDSFVCSMMDLFTDSKAKAALHKASLENIHLNYETKTS